MATTTFGQRSTQHGAAAVLTRSAAKCVGLDLAILVIRIRYNRCQKQDSRAGDSPAQQVKHLLPT